MGIEHFNNFKSWIAKGHHPLAEPTYSLSDLEYNEEVFNAAAHLNRETIYQVTLEGKTRRCTFEKMHGVHCLFYDNVDDWRFCIYIGHLRRVVKRVKNVEPDCDGCHAADCTQSD